MRKQEDAAKVLLRMRQLYLDGVRAGLGRDDISGQELVDVGRALDAAFQEILLLKAKVELARALGVDRWFLASIVGEFPDRGADLG